MKTKPNKTKAFDEPCVPGKYHSVSLTTGICSNCHKQLMSPMYTKKQMRDLGRTLAQAMR